jgi:hypothetical protein
MASFGNSFALRPCPGSLIRKFSGSLLKQWIQPAFHPVCNQGILNLKSRREEAPPPLTIGSQEALKEHRI